VSRILFFRNRQRTRPINTASFRCLVLHLLKTELRKEAFELGIFFVGHSEMTRLNEEHLNHQGSTDVITFDYGDSFGKAVLAGEIFICVDEALTQAKRFGSTWQQEVMRYIVHGLLHLAGFDDKTATARRRMKVEENRILRAWLCLEQDRKSR
jgi:rRNA maturation RNase YbeY